MGGFSMNKVLGTIKRSSTFGGNGGAVSGAEEPSAVANPNGDAPEAVATRCVKQFCMSTGNSGDDVIYLPSIVDAAESSPAAAAECARLIRKYLGRDYWSKPACQYNAIMLIRILSDNPGATFTRNLDKKFVDVTKELLRTGRDGSVRQILMETLDAFENTKGHDNGLTLLIEMWKKEKAKAYKAYGGVPVPAPAGGPMMAGPAAAPGAYGPVMGPYPQQPHYPKARSSSKRLPEPVELANRLEEARTSAKLLEQFVTTTPTSEVLGNDLIKEFSDRCQAAARSIQGYMQAENPAPDNDTMEALIDTNEQLQSSLNQHRRAVLQAKKYQSENAQRQDTEPSSQPALRTTDLNRPVPPLPGQRSNGKGKATDNIYDPPSVAGPSRSTSRTPPRHSEDDPFRDPTPEPGASSSRRTPADDGGAGSSAPRPLFDPYDPAYLRTGESANRASDPVTPVSDDEDAYTRASSKKAEPVYRY